MSRADHAHVCLLFGVTGQTLEFYPPDAELLGQGAAAAATVTVWAGTQPNSDTPKIGPSAATLDSVSTTVASASGYSQGDPRRLNVTSSAGFAVGRRYLLQSATGQREIIVPRAVATGVVDLEQDLAYDYTTAATVVGVRQTLAVPDPFVQLESNLNVYGYATLFGEVPERGDAPPYRVLWSYATGGVTQNAWTTFDLQRKRARANLSIVDLREILPDVAHYEWLVQRGQNFDPQLSAAEKCVAIEARIAGYNPNAIIDPMIWDQIVLRQWAVQIGESLSFGSDQPEPPWVQRMRDKYKALFDKSIGITLKVWIDTSGTGAIDPSPPEQLWLRPR